MQEARCLEILLYRSKFVHRFEHLITPRFIADKNRHNIKSFEDLDAFYVNFISASEAIKGGFFSSF